MAEKNPKEPKQRILDAAISLFAKKGYAAVGVREIAKTANVNISMISYYFGGKVGILKAVINEFHDQYHQVVMNAIDESKPPEECVRSIVRNLVDFVRTNTELTMTAFNTLPVDIPEIVDLKAEKVARLIEAVSGFVNRFGLDSNDAVQMSLIGPALISIILTHFRFKSVKENVLHIEFDDAFYERYTEIITTLFLHGITGIAAQTQNLKQGFRPKMKGNNSENNR